MDDVEIQFEDTSSIDLSSDNSLLKHPKKKVKPDIPNSDAEDEDEDITIYINFLPAFNHPSKKTIPIPQEPAFINPKTITYQSLLHPLSLTLKCYSTDPEKVTMTWRFEVPKNSQPKSLSSQTAARALQKAVLTVKLIL